MNPSVDPVLDGHLELSADVGVAGVAEIGLLAGEKEFGSGGLWIEWQFVQTTSAWVCEERRMLAREKSLAWQLRHVSRIRSGFISEKARGMVASLRELRCAPFRGRGSPRSRCDRAEVAGGDASVMRVLVEIEPHVGVAGLAGFAAYKARVAVWLGRPPL